MILTYLAYIIQEYIILSDVGNAFLLRQENNDISFLEKIEEK